VERLLSAIPKWLIVAATVYVALLVSYAVFDNRQVEFWPPKIHSKGGDSGTTAKQEVWNVPEGVNGEWSAEWTVPSTRTVFTACKHLLHPVL
jgi:hypothetical protein